MLQFLFEKNLSLPKKKKRETEQITPLRVGNCRVADNTSNLALVGSVSVLLFEINGYALKFKYIWNNTGQHKKNIYEKK